MAENKMLIDATHPEETRVVVLRDGRVEEFDYESAARKLLRGSIFLAKITRVEPSLQAAFVDYGGNRHGFLAFNEIHPDYYQIPHADRLALLEEESYAQDRDSDDDDDDVAATEDDDGIAADADDDPNEMAQADANADAEPDEDQPDSEPAVGEADIDFEEAAIDVTEYLPPEPPTAEDTAAGSGESTSPDGSETVTEDQSPAAVSDADEVAVAEPAAVEASDSSVEITELEVPPVASVAPDVDAETDTSDSQPTGDEADAAPEKKGPRTIAAASAREDRIVSETIEPGESSEITRNDLDDNTQPIENGDKSETVDLDDTVAEASATAEPEASEAPEAAEGDAADVADQTEPKEAAAKPRRSARPRRRRRSAREEEPSSDPDDAEDGEDLDEVIDDVGNADAMEELPARRRRRARNYKIQEVIKRRQVVLVQVVKEERGNKGAALTTYLSLAGRYTVLMPNTARGGGISRKITNIQDRKRLKAIAQELDVPEGMGLIIRTAGASRTKQEIKRDFEYLLRLWENVRDLTLQSTAPSLVYEEGDLIKRSIRDLYSKDVEQVLVAGEDAHKEAKSFMRMLMPSHAKNVVRYEEPHPLFAKYRIEQQLNAMFSPFVQLPSGGYLVINQTEALVAVDVNSGKSTRKFSIEDTALNTNLEAAEELSRQLKLRDLAGLIVIDFIDMEEKRNNRAVERRLKECLRSDRARIQVGRISHFGLLEMSRQRLRTGVLEGSTMPCPHCQGTGIIRSTESVALAVLRALEDNLMVSTPRPMVARCSRDVAMYLLNQKRVFVQEMEMRYGVGIQILAGDEQQGADFTVERQNGGPALPRRVDRAAVNVDSGFVDEADREEAATGDDSEERRPRRRRRRRGGRRGEEDTDTTLDHSAANESEGHADEEATDEAAGDADNGSDGEERGPRRRRRGRRGGRRNRGERAQPEGVAAPGAPQPSVGASEASWPDAAESAGDTQPLQTATAIDIQTDGEEVDAALVNGAGASSDADTHDTAASNVMVASFDTTVDADAADSDGPAPVLDASSIAEPAAGEDTVAATGQDAPDDNGSETEPSEDLLAAREQQPDTAEIIEAPSAAESTTKTPRGEPVSSEPVLERVVMTPHTDDADDVGNAAPDAPARKGWWQRRFGS